MSIFAKNWGHTHTITITDANGAVVDVSAASSRVILFQSPDGTVASKAGALVTDGTDGKIRYGVTEADSTEDGVDSAPGEWVRQGQVTFSDGSYYTTPEKYTVLRPLA